MPGGPGLEPLLPGPTADDRNRHADCAGGQAESAPTGNEAFVARTEVVVKALNEGEDLRMSFARSRLLPEDFVNILANAEEGGRVAEMLRHQAEHYEEEASRRLTVLTKVAGWGIWMFVAGLMIFLIFRMYLTYFQQFDKLGLM